MKNLRLSDLSGATKEIDAMENALSAARVTRLPNEQATELEFRRVATQKEILHIVTHSIYFPTYEPTHLWDEFKGKENISAALVKDLHGSALILAGAGKSIQKWKRGEKTNSDDDGLLTLADVGKMDLSGVKLVVLSACETQLAPAFSSEGLLGFERGFPAAGADNVILTLWNVPDTNTARFFESFYKKLRGCEKSLVLSKQA